MLRMAAPAKMETEVEAERQEEKKRPKLIFGLDWSMTSPAAAARLFASDGRLVHTWLMCFQQRRATQELVEHKVSPEMTLTVFPMYPASGEKGRWAVLAHHMNCLDEWTDRMVITSVADITAYIEDYAFGVKKTNSFSKLCEDGGSACLAMYRMFCIDPKPVAISKVKKHWSGNGAATKDMMYRAWLRRGLSELRDLLRCSPGDNPYSDVVDALAVLETGRAM